MCAVRSTVNDIYLCIYAVLLQHLTDFLRESCQTFLLTVFVLLDESGNHFVLMGTTIAEAQVLQLNLYVVQTEAVSQRRIEKVGLSGNLHLLVGTHTAQRAHVMHTVGKLHQQSTDVIVDGVEHLLVVIHLLGDFVVASALLGYDADQEKATSSPKR